jgi:hypothetical protein
LIQLWRRFSLEWKNLVPNMAKRKSSQKGARSKNGIRRPKRVLVTCWILFSDK